MKCNNGIMHMHDDPHVDGSMQAPTICRTNWNNDDRSIMHYSLVQQLAETRQDPNGTMPSNSSAISETENNALNKPPAYSEKDVREWEVDKDDIMIRITIGCSP